MAESVVESCLGKSRSTFGLVHESFEKVSYCRKYDERYEPFVEEIDEPEPQSAIVELEPEPVKAKMRASRARHG